MSSRTQPRFLRMAVRDLLFSSRSSVSSPHISLSVLFLLEGGPAVAARRPRRSIASGKRFVGSFAHRVDLFRRTFRPIGRFCFVLRRHKIPRLSGRALCSRHEDSGNRCPACSSPPRTPRCNNCYPSPPYKNMLDARISPFSLEHSPYPPPRFKSSAIRCTTARGRAFPRFDPRRAPPLAFALVPNPGPETRRLRAFWGGSPPALFANGRERSAVRVFLRRTVAQGRG